VAALPERESIMQSRTELAVGKSRRTPLAACLASILGLSASPAIAATTFYVDRCDEGIVQYDETHGSLRWALLGTVAQSGDIIDMTSVKDFCSTISLTTGDLPIPQDSLTIIGPGASYLTIDASNLPVFSPHYARVFTHKGAGTLSISDVTLTGGDNEQLGYYGTFGGCLYSPASVDLYRVVVSSCKVKQVGNYPSGGGGVFAGSLKMRFSTLSGNSAAGGVARGGGARVQGKFEAFYSTISDNGVGSQGYGGGGGLYGRGDVRLVSSTISGNHSNGTGGGVYVNRFEPGLGNFYLISSTISGNSAGDGAGGLSVNSGYAGFRNSTIAFNTQSNFPPPPTPTPGVLLKSGNAGMFVVMQSTLLSNNAVYGFGGPENDLAVFSVPGHPVLFNDSPTNPGYSLIRASSYDHAKLPQDTIFDVCPLLGSLHDNGGLTRTHALQSGSPAINTGNNILQMAYDQRGSAITNGVMDYLRPSGGSDLYTDIGAYEVQLGDIVFDTGFEGCPPLLAGP
jgi:hypothetical protein